MLGINWNQLGTVSQSKDKDLANALTRENADIYDRMVIHNRLGENVDPEKIREVTRKTF